MVAPKTYRAVNQCIYCGTTNQTDRALGEEHIIPRAWLGKLILKAASCECCEAITSSLETKCVESMFVPLKAQFKIKGRKSRKIPTHIPLITIHLGQEIVRKLGPDVHPSAFIMFAYQEPTIMLGLPARETDREKVGARFVIAPIVTDFWQRVQAQNAEIKIADNVNAMIYARTLAKIAHSFAFAECRERGWLFEPFLRDVIFDDSLRNKFHHYIGSLAEDAPPSDQIHEISIAEEESFGGPAFLVVRLRLFATIPATPTHTIVVGRRL